jgi:hypothetical protein
MGVSLFSPFLLFLLILLWRWSAFVSASKCIRFPALSIDRLTRFNLYVPDSRKELPPVISLLIAPCDIHSAPKSRNSYQRLAAIH